eukprot:jgi/Psemu1/52211/gm1.52211_g
MPLLQKQMPVGHHEGTPVFGKQRGQGPQEGLTAPAWTKRGTEEMTPGLSPIVNTAKEEIKANNEQVKVILEKSTKLVRTSLETYPTWLWYVGLRLNTLRLNSQFDVSGRGPEGLPWTKLDVGAHYGPSSAMWESDKLHMVLKITGSQGKLSTGKKQKQTPNLHNGIVLPGWKSGSTWFSHHKLGGVMDGWFLILSSRAHNNNFVAEPKPQQSNSSKGWLKWSRKRRRISLPHLSRKDIVKRSHDERRNRDALINHETPGKVLAGAFRCKLLVSALQEHPTAKVCLPNEEETQQCINAIAAKYPVLSPHRVWGACNGLKLHLQQSDDWTKQDQYYSGWTFFSAQMGGSGLMELMYELYKAKVVVNLAFKLCTNDYLIRSSQYGPLTTCVEIPEGTSNEEAAQVTSVRQMSEWGMRQIQGGFP